MFNKSVIAFAAVCIALLSAPVQAQHEGMQMPAKDTQKTVAPKKTKPTTRTTKKSPAKATQKAASKAKPKSAAKTTVTKDSTTRPPADTTQHQMPSMRHDSVAHTDSMTSMPASKPDHTMAGSEPVMNMMTGPLGISMDRMGSGTTWIPDASKMPSRHIMKGDWEIMTHGFAFVQYDKQNGPRGDEQFGSLNWMMLMASRKLAGGQFQARTMLSLDAWTVTEKGYPLLLQTGEALDGRPLHDRQHPHDFWMELGALYQREINSTLAWSLYAAPSGEPALGPVAFMHRPSAMDNPSAPLSHHWQDATHVSFGAVTAGLFGRTWQLEASSFNGREPDQNRWNFDPIKLDSYSARLTVNPNANWSVSAGSGYLKTPEALHPEESIVRYTASVLNGRAIGGQGQLANTLIWGANKPTGLRITHSLLGETEAILDPKNTFFGRAEFVQKSLEDLALEEEGSSANPIFNVTALQIGYIREIAKTHWATIGVGGSGTLNIVPASLKSAYGSRTPTGLFLFLRMRPLLQTKNDALQNSGAHSASH